MNDLRTDEDGNWIDPRICPVEHEEYAFDKEKGYHVETGRMSTEHEWHGFRLSGNDPQDARCEHCDALASNVRESFHEWRFEMVVARLDRTLDQVAAAVRRLH